MIKNLKYFKYICIHKWFVFLQCLRFIKIYPFLGFSLLWRGIVHDLSKFRRDEWIPYREYYYGKNKAYVQNVFDLAWLKHIHRNKHHWQYYILLEDEGNTKLIEMPFIYVLEMVADWVGAGIAITGKMEVWNWYEKNKHRMQFHPNVRMEVEDLIADLKTKFSN